MSEDLHDEHGVCISNAEYLMRNRPPRHAPLRVTDDEIRRAIERLQIRTEQASKRAA